MPTLLAFLKRNLNNVRFQLYHLNFTFPYFMKKTWMGMAISHKSHKKWTFKSFHSPVMLTCFRKTTYWGKSNCFSEIICISFLWPVFLKAARSMINGNCYVLQCSKVWCRLKWCFFPILTRNRERTRDNL